ncbi:hypothetical protein ACLKA6_010430 [Drosophila palustris]
MDKINELIEAQMILGNELEQLYLVAAAEASSMDSLQLRRLKDDFTHHKNLFIQQRKGLQMSMEINKVMAENFPYFEEEYEDKFISLISKTSMILRRISLKETAANEIKHQKPWWHDFRFGNDRDDSLSLFASKTQSNSVTQKVTTNKPWYDFTFGDNRDQENMPKSKTDNNLKSKYHLEKDTFGINYSFPPAKKQWEEEGEQQVTQKEVSPEKALLKLTDPKKFEDLLGSSHIMLSEKMCYQSNGNRIWRRTLPRQREQDLEKKQLELEKKQLNLEKQQLELEKKQLNLEKQQKREMQLILEKLQNLESQQKLEKQLNLERQQNLEKLQNLERQLKLEKQQHLEKLQNLEKQLELEKLQNLENQQKLEKQLKLEKQQKLRKQQKLEIQQELEKNRKFVSFPPAKKQREEEGEQQVAKNEVSPKKALQKLTDVRKSDNLLTEERKNTLPKQRNQEKEAQVHPRETQQEPIDKIRDAEFNDKSAAFLRKNFHAVFNTFDSNKKRWLEAESKRTPYFRGRYGEQQGTQSEQPCVIYHISDTAILTIYTSSCSVSLF